jgi:hypothetical protein
MKAGAYWAIVVALILFGWLAIFSIGAPFLLLGITLAVLFPWRTRRGALATGMAVILGLVVGYVIVAPLSCTGTATAVSVLGGAQSEGSTTCNNLLGITYQGSGIYNPSLLPALLGGIALAAIAGVTTAWIYRRHPGAHSGPGSTSRVHRDDASDLADGDLPNGRPGR